MSTYSRFLHREEEEEEESEGQPSGDQDATAEGSVNEELSANENNANESLANSVGEYYLMLPQAFPMDLQSKKIFIKVIPVSRYGVPLYSV